MSNSLPESGQATALVLVALTVLAVPGGFALAQGMSSGPMATSAALTPTAPPVGLPTTPTPTGTDGEPGDSPPQGNTTTLVVEAVDAPLGGGTEECPAANYTEIQPAVDDAGRGDTVAVCGGDYDPVEIETPNLTLRAHGVAAIESQVPTRAAVRTTAPGVTVQGFTLRAPQSSVVLAVGGADSLVRTNTVEVANNDSTGIFLGDGHTPGDGDPDSTIGAATGSRVVANTVNVTAPDADGSGRYTGIFTDADRTVVRANAVFPNDDTTSIRSAGNATVVRNNTIRNLDPCRQGSFNNVNACKAYNNPPGIVVGKYQPEMYGQSGGNTCGHSRDHSLHEGHDWAQRNRILNNTIDHTPGEALHVMGTGAHPDAMPPTRGVRVRNNRFIQTGGIVGHVEGALVANNTVDAENYLYEQTSMMEGDNEPAICFHAHDTLIVGNTLDGYTVHTILITNGVNVTIRDNLVRDGGFAGGIRFVDWGSTNEAEDFRVLNNTVTETYGGVQVEVNVSVIAGNDITSSLSNGVSISANVSEFRHNTIVGHNQTGVVLSPDATVGAFHHNVIDDNGQLGIHKENQDPTDGQWPILNATRNFWGCGGPSSGLEDPHTHRVANGSGDAISAGDDAGVSNVHFDPFYVRPGLSCPANANPTPAPSPTPDGTTSPTPTPSPTPSATPSPTPPLGSGNGTAGPGTGGPGTATAGTGPTGGPGENRSGDPAEATPPPSTVTPTQPPSPTQPPTPTPSPTPRVEPGFGVTAWLGGALLLAALVTVRRARNRQAAGNHRPRSDRDRQAHDRGDRRD